MISTFTNFILASFFVLVIAGAALAPLPFLRLASSGSESVVLGLSTSSKQLKVSSSVVSHQVVEISALAYPDQKTYYQKIFKVVNNSGAIKKYRLEVVSVSPEATNLSAQVYFESADQTPVAILKAGAEKEVNLILSLGPTGQTLPQPYTLKILVVALD